MSVSFSQQCHFRAERRYLANDSLRKLDLVQCLYKISWQRGGCAAKLPSETTRFICFPCLGAVFSVIHWVCGRNLMSVCPSICPSPPYSALGLFHMGAESTFLHHASTQTAEGLHPTGQELAVVSIVLCRQPSAAFSPSTITPVASPSHRGCTHVRRSHVSALPSAFVSIGPACWSSSSLK